MTPAVALANPAIAAFAVVQAAALVGLSYVAWRAQSHRVRQRAARVLRRVPYSPIASAPVGQVTRVVGRVKPLGAPLVSPVSKRECVYVRIEVRVPVHKDPILDLYGADTPFLLADDSGVAAIHPAGADCSVESATIIRVDAQTSANDPARRFVDARVGPRAGPMFVHEWIIECATTLAVVGTATRDSNLDASSVDGGYRDAHRQLHFAHTTAIPLRLSDEPTATDPTIAP